MPPSTPHFRLAHVATAVNRGDFVDNLWVMRWPPQPSTACQNNRCAPSPPSSYARQPKGPIVPCPKLRSQSAPDQGMRCLGYRAARRMLRQLPWCPSRGMSSCATLAGSCSSRCSLLATCSRCLVSVYDASWHRFSRTMVSQSQAEVVGARMRTHTHTLTGTLSTCDVCTWFSSLFLVSQLGWSAEGGRGAGAR